MDSVVKLVQDKLISKNEFPSFSAGDTLTVTIEIREGDKVRPQSFKGVVIQVKGRGTSKTFTIDSTSCCLPRNLKNSLFSFLSNAEVYLDPSFD